MLELHNVTLSVAGKTLLRPLSFQVAAGEIVTLMGPSGAGKSSLLSFIGGDLSEAFTAAGLATLNGTLLNGLAPERRRVARLFQVDLLFPHMTVAENLLFAVPRAPQAERLAAMRTALAQAELADFEERPPHTLSGGQRSRVALFRALLSQPAAILLDEPFSRLDQDLRQTIRDITFGQIRARNIPALLVSHDRSDAPQGGRVLRIAADGSISDA